MPDAQPGQSRATRRNSGPIVALGMLTALSLAACSATTPTTTTTETPSIPSTAPSTDGSSPSTEVTAPPGAGQTDTDWGRIWDTIPAEFPVYPGVTPAAETATRPVSGVFALEGVDPRTIATWMRTELERAAYRTEALNGPLEDGSFVLDLIGSAPDCRVQVAVAPLGAMVTVTVRYGAVCPHP